MNKLNDIYITATSSISALGANDEVVFDRYLDNKHYLSLIPYENEKLFIGKISDSDMKLVESIRINKLYKHLDKTVLLAIYTAREVYKKSNWNNLEEIGVNIGSSRGATTLLESYFTSFLNDKRVPVYASPTTSLGNISSWISHDLQLQGPNISHSITCSSALHALLNGVVWLNSGELNHFIVGGSESANTPFTLSQIKSLGIYSKEIDKSFPCRAMDLNKSTNTFVLGEGACMIALEKGATKRLAKIEGVGYATEVLSSSTSLSANASCLINSMRRAICNYKQPIDVVITHTPGTQKGDVSEYKAIQAVFEDPPPFITTNKWKLGHTFGASGAFSIEMAVMMLIKNKAFEIPYFSNKKTPKNINSILVNSTGFGGNAVSVLLSK